MRTYVNLNDLQYPYHDPWAEELVLNFIHKVKPYGVVLNGDVIDAQAVGKFQKDPVSGMKDLDWEIELAQGLMEEISKAGVRDKIWLDGNHEDRVRKELWNNAEILHKFGTKAVEAACEALSIPHILELKKFGFKYKPYMEPCQIGKLLVVHGRWANRHSAYSARAAIEKYGRSVMIAHSHRLGAHFVSYYDDEFGAWENGCLCDLNPEWSKNNNWQQGFSVVHVEEKTGLFNVQLIPILKRKMFFFGEEKFQKKS